MREKAQLIYLYFGAEKQKLKAQEEYLELNIALMELRKFDIKSIIGNLEFEKVNGRQKLIYDCNEEFGDNVLMAMQINDSDFEEVYEVLEDIYLNTQVKHLGLKKFKFDKEEVKKIVQEKIERTIKRFNIEVLKELTNYVKSCINY